MGDGLRRRITLRKGYVTGTPRYRWVLSYNVVG